MLHDLPLTKEQRRRRAEYERAKARRLAEKGPDPISTLTPETLAYIAGLIDGEGSIFVTVGPKGGTVYPTVVVAMTHKPVIEWLASTVAAGKAQLHNQTNLHRHPYMKPQYRFQVFGKRARLLCETLLPYLRVKTEQARLVSLFPVDGQGGRGKTLDQAISEERLRLRDQINGLNHVMCRDTAPSERRKSFLRAA